MSGTPRRHHLVPEFYLRYFANQNSRAQVIELPGDRSYVTHTRNIIVETGFYDLDGVAIDRRADVERELSNLEGAAAQAWPSLTSFTTWPPSVDAMSAIAAWITLQFARGRSGLWRWNEGGRALLRTLAAAGGREAAKQYLNVTDDEIDGILGETDDSAPAYTPPRNDFYLHMFEMVANHSQGLLNHTWTLIEFERRTLTTCDNPVVFLVGNPDPGRSTGLLTAQIVAIPVGRNHALLLERGMPHAHRVVAGTTNVARGLNERLARNADRCVVHHPDDDPVSTADLRAPRHQRDYTFQVSSLGRPPAPDSEP